jgi:hypothetical protein
MSPTPGSAAATISSPTRLEPSETLLSYALTSSPAPVQVNPTSSDPSKPYSRKTGLTIVASAPVHKTIAVKEIAIHVPVGNPAKPDATDLTDDPDFHPSVVPEEEWEVKCPTASSGTFLVMPKGEVPRQVSSLGIEIHIDGIVVNTRVGIAELKITEVAAEKAQLSDEPPRQGSIAVPKFPFGFSAGNLRVETPVIEYGTKPVLKWDGTPGATYKMLWGKGGSEEVSDTRTWSPPEPLTETTTFTLQIEATELGEEGTFYCEATQQVAEPSVKAHDLSVTATVELMQKGETLGLGSHIAPTDGFVLATVFAPAGYARGYRCIATLTIFTPELVAQVTGGNVSTLGSVNAPSSQTCMAPVAAGQAWSAGIFNAVGNEVNPLYTLTWIPLGSG